MHKINSIFSRGSKYQRLSGPLRAAQICDSARALADSRFTVLSYVDGLLTVGVESSAAAANLNFETEKIIKEVNEKVGQDFVKKIRTKII
jgi:hypothetical protein